MAELWLSCVCRYNEKMRSFTSGVRAVNLARCDIVDVIHIDGDIHTVGSSGTVLVGFHTAGQVKIEPAAKPQRKSEPELQPERKQEDIMEIAEEEKVDRQGGAAAAAAAAAAAVAASGELGFFGEMMRFTCCTADFTTKIIGPQTYVVEHSTRNPATSSSTCRTRRQKRPRIRPACRLARSQPSWEKRRAVASRSMGLSTLRCSPSRTRSWRTGTVRKNAF